MGLLYSPSSWLINASLIGTQYWLNNLKNWGGVTIGIGTICVSILFLGGQCRCVGGILFQGYTIHSIQDERAYYWTLHEYSAEVICEKNLVEESGWMCWLCTHLFRAARDDVCGI